jgi:hypothetical protein
LHTPALEEAVEVMPKVGWFPQSAPGSDRRAETGVGTAFDWSAAAIGALVAAITCIVAIGLVLSVRRRHEPSAA